MNLYEIIITCMPSNLLLDDQSPMLANIKGYYTNESGIDLILINKRVETIAEKVCILAEELGHYHTTVGNILDQSKLQNRKQERRARAWSYQRLLPLENLIKAHKTGIRTRHELAEYLGITEQYLIEALNYYKEKHGICCHVGGYWICFEPLGIIEDLENKQHEENPPCDRRVSR